MPFFKIKHLCWLQIIVNPVHSDPQMLFIWNPAGGNWNHRRNGTKPQHVQNVLKPHEVASHLESRKNKTKVQTDVTELLLIRHSVRSADQQWQYTFTLRHCTAFIMSSTLQRQVVPLSPAEPHQRICKMTCCSVVNWNINFTQTNSFCKGLGCICEWNWGCSISSFSNMPEQRLVTLWSTTPNTLNNFSLCSVSQCEHKASHVSESNWFHV